MLNMLYTSLVQALILSAIISFVLIKSFREMVIGIIVCIVVFPVVIHAGIYSMTHDKDAIQNKINTSKSKTYKLILEAIFDSFIK